MLGSGSFTHGEMVTAAARVFCPKMTLTVDSMFIERILVGVLSTRRLSQHERKNRRENLGRNGVNIEGRLNAGEVSGQRWPISLRRAE
jgi:hypothetical protein